MYKSLTLAHDTLSTGEDQGVKSFNHLILPNCIHWLLAQNPSHTSGRPRSNFQQNEERRWVAYLKKNPHKPLILALDTLHTDEDQGSNLHPCNRVRTCFIFKKPMHTPNLFIFVF